MSEVSISIIDDDKIQRRIWDFIHHQFTDNENCLVRHHLDSYNDFYKRGIQQIFRDNNPLILQSGLMQPGLAQDDGVYAHTCNIYLGGKDGSAIYYGKPIIYEQGTQGNRNHFMFPNEARLRNMSYSMSVHYDVEVEIISLVPVTASDAWSVEEEKESTGGARVAKSKMVAPAAAAAKQKRTILRRTFPKVYLGKFPVMLQSEFCILHGMPREMRYNVGECRNDPGGYFIIDGKEKVVISQEKFADNALYVHNHHRDINELDDDEALAKTVTLKPYMTTAEIRSVSENPTKPIRKAAVHLVAPTQSYKNRNIVVEIPNVRKPVPLFIVFRALGILSDKSIMEACVLDLDKYAAMLDLFIPSVYDAGPIYSQAAAIQYITALTKYDKSPEYALEILSDYFLPHVGETNFIEKAYYLGYMVFRLLAVHTGLEEPVDRDHYKHKRLEITGTLLYDLFREYYLIQCEDHIMRTFEHRLYYKTEEYGNNLAKLIDDNFKDAFRERAVESGFSKAYKGNWGATPHTKRVATIQDLDRISFHSIICHLRKTNLPLDSTSKVVGPRLLHSSQWAIVDPVDTPDGGNIGLLKTLSLSVIVSTGYSREQMLKWLLKNREMFEYSRIADHSPKFLSNKSKVVVNGYWAGVTGQPRILVDTIIRYRRFAIIPTFTSATFDIRSNTVVIYTDAGRLCRPVFHCAKAPTSSVSSPGIQSSLERGGEFPKSWAEIVSGTVAIQNAGFESKDSLLASAPRIYDPEELYGEDAELPRNKEAIVDFVDSSETENALIATDVHQLHRESATRKFTHLEIHESLIFGYMCNHTIFPENNPVARNQFSCSQSRQAVSVYNTNYSNRMDKTGIVLTYGQIPLLKSRYLKYFTREEQPYGVNAIVAIMCYTGYNVEDAILLNEASVKRGMFQTNYYNTYYAHEETTEHSHVSTNVRFTNIEAYPDIIGTKPKADYSKLDERGLIRENATVDENTVVIGLATSTDNKISSDSAEKRDASITPKRGQLGVVDKVYMTEDEEGKRIAKVRVRELRRPNLGDKMASRAGQKGTCGNIIPERDMPFTRDGLRPDMIINPHAIPTRMTIGQLVECIMGKACLQQGAFGDCTAFNNKSTEPLSEFGRELARFGYHSQGDEVMYNGMTGEQLESSIFIGPTYYMRLKHMVKDKVNFRGLGPNTSLTRQPVSGRANDGGLRIGEMERDVLVSHGIQAFLQESMMERSDDYYFAVCNTTGMTAIYNPSKNLFMSPAADGPINFTTTKLGEDEVATGDVFVDKVTRFGRSFSVLRVPYSFKLLMQELQAINVQMRIITEDNIDQFDHLNTLLPSELEGVLKEKKPELPKDEEKKQEKPEDKTEKQPMDEELQEEEWQEEVEIPATRLRPDFVLIQPRREVDPAELAARYAQIDPKNTGVVKMYWRGNDHTKYLYTVYTTMKKPTGLVSIQRSNCGTIQNVSILDDLYIASEYDEIYHPTDVESSISYKWTAAIKPPWGKDVLRWHAVEPLGSEGYYIVPERLYIDNMEFFDKKEYSFAEFSAVNGTWALAKKTDLEPVCKSQVGVAEDEDDEPTDLGPESFADLEENSGLSVLAGGKTQRKKQSHSWKHGDVVFYREDYAKPSRPWIVKHVSDESNYITIDTKDLDGIGVEDSVRVVYPEMLYDKSQVLSFEDLLGRNQVDMRAVPEPGYLPAVTAQPRQQQQPVGQNPVNVVVVTGDNSSAMAGLDTNPNNTNPTNNLNPMNPMSPMSPMSPIIVPKQPEVIQQPQNPVTTTDGDIDFNSTFVIKKIE